MSEPWTFDSYPYREVELKPHMLCELAERHFPSGSVLQRKWLVEEAPRRHVELGGKPTSADRVSQAKKARATLLAGEWEEAGYGSIRRIGVTSVGEEGGMNESLLAGNRGEIPLTAEEWFGAGEETVYCYTFPSLIELARLKGDLRMPMKIGKTASSSLERVSLQCGVSNPEQPVIPLAVRVENAALFERAIHRILTIWNRWMDNAPGAEWFNTSKPEIMTIVSFLNNPPSHGELELNKPDLSSELGGTAHCRFPSAVATCVDKGDCHQDESPFPSM
jgi:hypothetical protein